MSTSKIFISYRREDCQGTANHLHEKLEGHFGMGNIFFDVDSIPIGRDFVEYLDEQVSQCDVLLALVGQRWLDANSEDGVPRLHSENDFVRIEITSALNREITVVPILVEGAGMPTKEMLPPELERFSQRQAAHVRPGRDFRRDVDDLIKALESMGLVAEPKSEITKRDLSNQPKEGALKCPCCWQTFEVIEICYVAKHPALLGDPVLGSDHLLRFVPTKWKDGKPLDPKGEVCDERACPKCHDVLPRNVQSSMQRSIENTD